MADMNELKSTVLGALGSAVEKTRFAAEKAADKAKDMAKVTKLNMQISAEKSNVEKAYMEIGKLYYDTRKNDPDSFFVQLCNEITRANENISKLQDEADCLKVRCSKSDDGSIEVEFEEISAEEAVSEEDFANPDDSTQKPSEQ